MVKKLLVLFAIALSALALVSCGDDDMDNAGTETEHYDGMFVPSMLQHPIMSMNQAYFRPEGSERGTEWIASLPEGMEVEINKPVRVYGEMESIEAENGNSGVKGKASYGGTILYVEKIEYK